MLTSIGKATVYVTELTVGFETNLNVNAVKKHGNCLQFTFNLFSDYHVIKLISLSLNTSCIFGKSFESFLICARN